MDQERDVLEEFGHRLRDLRKERGFSQETFASHVGLDRTYIGGIERGERNPSLRNIVLIANGLGLSVSELLEGVGSGGGND